MEKNNKVWCVKTHIACNCDIITDEVRLFKYLEDAEKDFNKIVEEKRKDAIDDEFVIEYDDSRNFVAYEKDYYVDTHICVNLFQIEIE